VLEKLAKLELCEKDEHLARWIEGNKGARNYEGYLQDSIRGIGWLDVELREEERFHLEDYWAKDPAAFGRPEARLHFFKLMHLSELWVLGGYEIIRTIDQRFSNDPNASALFSAAQKKHVKRFKHLFERNRVPLAKAKPSRRHAETGSSSAAPLAPFTERRVDESESERKTAWTTQGWRGSRGGDSRGAEPG
jgi:hypothetical protein